MAEKKTSLIPSMPTEKDMLKHVQTFWRIIPDLYKTISNINTGTGSGNVSGPSGARNNEICVFNTATGKLIKGSGKVIADFATVIHSHTKAQVGLGNVENIKFNLYAVTAPTSSNDSTEGYSACSLWWDSSARQIYVCVSAVQGAAVWNLLGKDAGESIAGENISAYRVVHPSSDSKIYVCDSSNAANAETACGITFKATSINQPVSFVSSGYLSESSWNWDLTKPIFSDSLGRLTQTVPTSGFIQIIATPVTPTRICVNMKNAITL